MYAQTRGLVLRAVTYKEADKILTVLTEDRGKLTVSAHGARRKSSKIAAAAQVLAFSEMTLYARAGRWSLREARTVSLFPGLQADILRLAQGAYFAELLDAVSDVDTVDADILSLALRALYATSAGAHDLAQIKAAFELRLMCLAGYRPNVSACTDCSAASMVSPYLDVVNGQLFCEACIPLYAEGCLALNPGSLKALRYIAASNHERVFSFSLGDESLDLLCRAAEHYVLAQLERKFRTLDYLKGLSQL